MRAAVDEMGSDAGFRGYGPEQGYDFLIDLIREHDYASRGVEIARDEVFVSDGSKCDCGNIQEIFGQDIRLAIPDPVYPVYIDTNVMAGRTGALWADANRRYRSAQTRAADVAGDLGTLVKVLRMALQSGVLGVGARGPTRLLRRPSPCGSRADLG